MRASSQLIWFCLRLGLFLVSGGLQLLQAQYVGPFYCGFDIQPPPLVRAEGRAEMTGDLVLVCQGGVQGTTTTTDIYLYSNAPLSPRWIASGVTAPSDVLLFAGNTSAAPVAGSNILQGMYTSTSNGPAIYFPSVVMANPGSGTSTFRFKNLKVDASALGPNQQITASIAFTAVIPILNSTIPVAYTAPGASFALQTAAGTAATNLTFNQGGGSNVPLVGNASATGGSVNYNLVFREGFAQSFKKRNIATTYGNPTVTGDQSSVTAAYNTESGYYVSSLSGLGGLSDIGLATQGTLLTANFINIPAGASIYVTTAPLGTTGTPAAALVNTASPNALISPASTVSAAGNSLGIAPVQIANGSGTATWQVFSADPAVVENFTFGVVVAYSSPLTGTGQVTGELGPIGTSFPLNLVPPTPLPVPRFADQTPRVSGCQATACLIATPAAVSVSLAAGSAPITVPVQLSSTGAAISFAGATATPDSASGGTWLSVANSGGTSSTPGTLTLTINAAGVTTGSYLGQVTVMGAGGVTLTTIPVILTVTAQSANQLPLSCVITNGSVTPTAALEGIAEIASDVLLVCTGGTPGVVQTATLQLTANTNITSRILNPSTGASEALLLLDEPNSGEPNTINTFTVGSNVFQGYLTGPSTVTFPNIPLAGVNPGSQRVLRVVNVRLDASQPAGLAPFIYANYSFANAFFNAAVTLSGVTATSLGSGTTATGLPNNVFASNALTLAFQQQAMNFALTGASGEPESSISFAQAGGANAALALSSGATNGTPTYYLNYTETFANAFKPRSGSLGGDPAVPVNQDETGQIFNSYTDFFNSGFPTANGLNQAGLATQGTRFMARFTNVPSGASIYVSTTQAAGSSSQFTARLVQTDATGAGAYVPVAATTTALIGGVTTPIARVPISGGTGTAVWEVVFANPSALDTAQFAILTAYAAPLSGTAIVDGSLAPLSTVHAADATSSVPRFVELGSAPAAMLTPPPGSQLAGSGVTFSWTPGAGVSQYVIMAGSTPGGADYDFVSAGAATSATLTGLPGGSRTVWVRLTSFVNGTPVSADYNYTAQTGTLQLAATLTDSGGFAPGRAVTFTALGSV